MLQFISTFESVIFSSELKEVKISSDSDITMSFVIAGSTVFTNSYSPDLNKNITVYALDEIYDTTRTSAINQCSIFITNTAGETAESVFTCIQCSAIVNATARYYLDRFFLIASFSDYRRTAPGRKERFWVYHITGSRTLKRTCSYVDENNQISTIVYNYSEPIEQQQLREISFDPADFAVTGKTLFSIVFSDGVRTLTYEVDTRQDIDSISFVYENSFGLLDNITYFGLKETELSAELETGLLNGKWVNSKAQAYQSIKVHSGYIHKDEIYPYIAFVTSPQHLIMDNRGYTRSVALTEQETKYSNDNSDLIDFSITFRREKDSMIVDVTDNRIFDMTFDDTFN